MEFYIIPKKEFESLKDEILEQISSLITKTGSGNHERWLRSKDVCERLNISNSSLQNLRKETLPYSRLQGTIFYRQEDIDRILESNMKNIRDEKA